MGKYVWSASTPFDQSSSNYRIGQSNGDDGRNTLIAELCNTAASTYGAAQARISLGGSSKTIRQTLGHVVPRAAAGRHIVLLDPSCHKSAFAGLIESGLDVVYLSRHHNLEFGICGPIDTEHLQTQIDTYGRNVAAVFITSPTYEGYCEPIQSIAEHCRRIGALLCIDSAWGSNFGIVDNLPPSPLAHADIVITSPHKKGGAPSQVGLVFFQSKSLADLYDEASRAGCATTSPNWPLLMLFEYRLNSVIDGSWSNTWQSAILNAQEFAERMTSINSLLSCPSPSDLGFETRDPTHVFVSTRAANIDAVKWARLLSQEHQIDVEMATSSGLLFLFGPENARQRSRLHRALRETLPQAQHPAQNGAAPSEFSAVKNSASIFNPRAAYLSASVRCPLEEACGRVSASLLYSYPPGVPELAYGEQVTSGHISRIRRLKSRGIKISGLNADGTINLADFRTTYPDKPALSLQRNPQETSMDRKTTRGLTIKAYPFGQTPKPILDDVAHLFREVFCNPPYNQFACNQSAPTLPVSFADLAPDGYAAAQDYLPLDILDKVRLPERTFRWMEPGEFEDRFRSKAAQLYVSAAHCASSGALVAFAVGRILTVRELFHTEEFRNPIYYSSREFIGSLKNEDPFFKAMDHHFALAPDDCLFFTLGYGAHPSIRGNNYLADLMSALAHNILPQHAQLPALAEIPSQGAGRIFSQAVHERTIYGLLSNEHAVVFARRLQTVMDHYLNGPRHLMKQVRNQARINKTQHHPHTSDHSGVEIRRSDAKGDGVFATQAIMPGELIAQFTGETYVADLESQLPPIMIDRCIQTGPREYVFAEHRLAEKINHSCHPNCGVREKTKIVAIKPIAPGDEISWDYRMSENSDWVLEPCLCGKERCSGRIEGYDSLPGDIRTEYLEKGAISTWLLDR